MLEQELYISCKAWGLVALGTTLDPYIVKSDSLIGSLVGLPNSLPPDIYDVTIELNLFETAVGTQELVKVDPIKIKESLRLNIGTAATLGSLLM